MRSSAPPGGVSCLSIEVHLTSPAVFDQVASVCLNQQNGVTQVANLFSAGVRVPRGLAWRCWERDRLEPPVQDPGSGRHLRGTPLRACTL